LINALGIHGVGEVMAADLANYFDDLDELRRAKTNDLQRISGIGPNTSESIVNWFSRPGNQQVLEKLRNAGVWPIREKKEMSEMLPLSSKVFVITGTLPHYSRDQAKRLIEENGGKVTDSVSRQTSFLVCGEAPGSKLDKAKELGIPIISEEQLKQLISK